MCGRSPSVSGSSSYGLPHVRALVPADEREPGIGVLPGEPVEARGVAVHADRESPPGRRRPGDETDAREATSASSASREHGATVPPGVLGWPDAWVIDRGGRRARPARRRGDVQPARPAAQPHGEQLVAGRCPASPALRPDPESRRSGQGLRGARARDVRGGDAGADRGAAGAGRRRSRRRPKMS